ncbi:MAG: MGMT family protein [Acidimicrobiales bacterium]
MAGPRPSSSFEQAVIAVVIGLEPGDLLSYGDVARQAGRPGAARAVGQVTARSEGLPWWRVINADGRLPKGHEEAAAARLRSEGYTVRNGRVVKSHSPD